MQLQHHRDLNHQKQLEAVASLLSPQLNGLELFMYTVPILTPPENTLGWRVPR